MPVIRSSWSRRSGPAAREVAHQSRQQHGIVLTLRKGKVVRLDYFGSKAEAPKAAGLSLRRGTG